MVWFVLLLLLVASGFLAYVNFHRKTFTYAGTLTLGTQMPREVKATRVTPDQKCWGKKFSVRNRGNVCAAANALHGRIYANDDAPPLPLSGCNCTLCECHYVDLSERRSQNERRSGHERRTAFRFDTKQDRRAEMNRRKSGASYAWRITV
jgi:hypothetical protein